jgi:hypothetical protein
MTFLDIHLGIFNMLSCSGWDIGQATNLGPISFDIGSPCMMAKLGMVLLFFIIALIRKWGAEEWGIPFSFWWATGAGMLAYIIAVTFTGSFKFAMLAGIVAMGIMGYIVGPNLDGGEGGYSEPNYG